MKSIVLGFAVMFVTMLAVASSCSITHRSGDYACTKTSECNDGRQCLDGFCVIPGAIDAANGDGPRNDAPNNTCPTPCTSCNMNNHTCTIDCAAAPAVCEAKVTCPTGWACNLLCDTDGSCTHGVSCAGTTGCLVTCSGHNACDNVVCGSSRCAVGCTGQGSCKDVACGNSCGCDVSCQGIGSCTGTVSCTADACRFGLGCSSAPATCHSCP